MLQIKITNFEEDTNEWLREHPNCYIQDIKPLAPSYIMIIYEEQAWCQPTEEKIYKGGYSL